MDARPLRRIVVCAALVLTAAGCGGVGYRIIPARLVLSDANGLSIQELRSAIGPKLVADGFDDLGIDEEMIELKRRTGVDEGALAVSELLHTYTYLSRRRHLRVEVVDYTGAARRRPSLPYEAPVGPFFEIRVSEERPGGFSASANLFLAELQEQLETLDGAVTLVTPPPPTDEAEYWRLTLKGYTAWILSWLTAFGITVTITGALSYAALRRAPLRVGAKRGVFVLINAWLATPLPFPVAAILVWTLPNLLAFPWTYPDYYRRVLDSALFSFPVSIALCVLIARRLFGASPVDRGAASAGHEMP
jgi:hypothetical protein